MNWLSIRIVSLTLSLKHRKKKNQKKKKKKKKKTPPKKKKKPVKLNHDEGLWQSLHSQQVHV